MSKKLERSLNIELERLNAKRDVAIGRVEDIDKSIERVEAALATLVGDGEEEAQEATE